MGLKISGVSPLEGSPALELPDVGVTGLTVTTTSSHTVAFLGTNSGNLIKVSPQAGFGGRRAAGGQVVTQVDHPGDLYDCRSRPDLMSFSEWLLFLPYTLSQVVCHRRESPKVDCLGGGGILSAPFSCFPTRATARLTGAGAAPLESPTPTGADISTRVRTDSNCYPSGAVRPRA